jgi:hypothetical protein
MALRVLSILVILLILYGCDQSSPPPAQSEKEDPEQLPAREKQQKATQEILQAPQQAATVACSDFYGPRDTQAYYDTRSTAGDTSCEEQEEHAEASCRMASYSSNENMSQQEAAAFSERVANEMIMAIEDDPSLTVGSAEDAALDRLDVPRYQQCES